LRRDREESKNRQNKAAIAQDNPLAGAKVPLRSRHSRGGGNPEYQCHCESRFIGMWQSVLYSKRKQLHQGMPALNVFDCGAMAHSTTAKNSPASQTVWPSDAPLRQAPQRLRHDSRSHTPMQLRINFITD